MYRKRLVHATLAGLALALVTVSLPGSAAAQDGVLTSLAAGFNGTSVAPGNTLWFNSVLKVKLPAGGGPVSINLSNAQLVVTAKSGGAVLYSNSVPNAVITYDPTCTLATTRHDLS